MLHFDELFRRKLAPLTRDTLEAIHRIDLFLALGRATEDLSLVFPKFVKARGGGDKGSQDDRTDGRTAARTEAARRGDEGNPDDDTGGTSSSTENESFVRTFPPNDPGIVCEGLFHPFLVEPVPNDIRLDTEQGFIFLTGPNMAGKTTLMKALGLAVYMAHLGLPVPCRSMRLALLDGVFSSLSVEDNLGKGYSFFYAEVRRVKDVAEQLHHGRHLLVLFDELFKGTNLKDALDGSRLVVDGFRGFPGSLFVLSSHLLELGEELVEFGEELIEPEAGPKVAAPFRIPIRFQRFDADVHEGQPRFSYILRDGVSTERLGMLILQNEGIPDLLRSPSRKKREKGRNSPAPIRDESDTRPGLRTDA
jgi:DNA mismatch repair ATPase MutS